jgi:hypothetical protein
VSVKDYFPYQLFERLPGLQVPLMILRLVFRPFPAIPRFSRRAVARGLTRGERYSRCRAEPASRQ